MIDVVFGHSTGGSLLSATKACGKLQWFIQHEIDDYDLGIGITPLEDHEDIVLLNFSWDIGFLQPSEESEYRMKLPASLYFGDYVRLHPKEEPKLLEDGKQNLAGLNKLKEYAGQKKAFRVWYGCNAEEMCGFYYVCSILKDYDVDIYAVELPCIHITGNRIAQTCSWGYVLSAEYGLLERNKRLLSQREVEYTASLWEELKEENAPLRACIAGVITSVPEDFYDGLIMRYFTKEIMRETEIMEPVMALSLGLRCGLMEQRLWQMGLSGKIELIKDGEECKHRVWKKCCVASHATSKA